MLAARLARLVLVLTISLPFAGTAHGHAVVVESDPADGAVLAVAPDRIRIRFNEPVSLLASQVLDASGRNIAASEAASASNDTVEIALPPLLENGTYVASYRVVSLDGHPISGSLMFSIGEASTSNLIPSSSGDRAWRAAWVAARATLNAGVLGSTGGILFLILVAGAGQAAASAARIAARLAMMGIAAAALSIGVQGGLLTDGPIESITSPALWHTGLASAFGKSTLIAIAGLVLIAAGMRWPFVAGRAVAVAGAAIALASYVRAGHVVTAGPPSLTVPALLAHTSAVAFWIGSLLPLRAALTEDNAAKIVRRFSFLAMWAVGALVAAGIAIAVLQVRGFSALVTTAYGWTLLVKLALVGALLSLAAVNNWRLTPALARRDPGAAKSLRRTINAELVLVIGILIATAALGTLPPPRAQMTDHRHMPGHHPSHDHRAQGFSVQLVGAGRLVTLAFSSARAGANAVEIAISGGGGGAVEAQEVTFTAANPEAGVERVRRKAVRVRPGVWKVEDLLLVPGGQWSVGVEALVSDFEKQVFEGAVQLR